MILTIFNKVKKSVYVVHVYFIDTEIRCFSKRNTDHNREIITKRNKK